MCTARSFTPNLGSSSHGSSMLDSDSHSTFWGMLLHACVIHVSHTFLKATEAYA